MLDGHQNNKGMSSTGDVKVKLRDGWVRLIKSPAFRRSALGILIGGTGGFLYYYFKDCDPSVCTIAGNPYYSTLWGGFMGWFMVNSPCARGRC
jgi:hypothetical protein